MPLSDIVQISVSVDSANVTQAGFGVPLILSAEATFAERTRTYSTLDGVLADFAITTATYLACAAMFAQDPRPETVIVGRCANKPTQKWTVDLGSAGILNSTRYRLQVIDTATGTRQNADFTTDSTATEAELWAGLAAAYNALVGPTATAVNTGPGTSLVITGDTAGVWHSLAVINPSGQYDSGVYMSIVQDHADPGVAADLAAIKDENDTWYGVCSLYNSKLYVQAIAAYVESNKKFYLAGIQDSATVTAAAGGTDTADELKDSAYARTAAVYHPDNASFIAAAYLGYGLPLDPGSETWKFMRLAGVPVYPITATHQTNLNAKHCNYFYSVAGRNITTEGTVAANEFIDTVRFVDWLEARIAESVFARLSSGTRKVPLTDPGIAVIESVVRARLKDGVDVGGLAADPAPTVTVPKSADISDADRAIRMLRGVRFTGELAGAIHKLIISGTVTGA